MAPLQVREASAKAAGDPDATGWAAAGFLFLGLLSTLSMGTRRRPDEAKASKAKA